MCGIVGQFSKINKINKDIAEKMLLSIKHRGPDDSGTYFDLDKNVFLGHNRLSLQDLSELGHQPMWDFGEEVGVVFNGEIYNFKEIRSELGEYNFKSKTDTEVIIYAYKKWGLEKTLEKFNGMFAFCLYDRVKNKIFLVRDRIGIKPLVYYWDKNNLIFASELKAILKSDLVGKEIRKDAVLDYFVYRYIPNPKTIYKNFFKLEPGHFLELDLNKFSLKKECYWSLQNSRNLYLSEADTLEKIEEIIQDSVRLRLVSDTPVASFLSGGVDSSLISVLANRENAELENFSVDLQPSVYSEVEFAKSLAKEKEMNLNVKKIGGVDFEKNFEKIISFYDEPFADSSLVPTFLLCDFVKGSGYKTVLSGDGADEIFYGYTWYRNFNILNKFNFLPKELILLFSKIPYLHPFSFLMSDSLEMYRRTMFNRFTVEEVNKLFNFNFDKKNSYFYKEKICKEEISVDEINYLDFITFLVDDILYKVDIASMANSIEVRVPYLDHRLVELVFLLKFKLLYKNKERKHLLKKISLKYLPKKNIYRKKKGFSAPVMKWINKDLRSELLDGEVVKSGMISRQKMESFVLNESNNAKIWQMYVFNKWYTNYMK